LHTSRLIYHRVSPGVLCYTEIGTGISIVTQIMAGTAAVAKQPALQQAFSPAYEWIRRQIVR